MTARELAVKVEGIKATMPAMAAAARGFGEGDRLGDAVGVGAAIGVGLAVTVRLGVTAGVGLTGVVAAGVALALGVVSAQAPMVARLIIDKRRSRHRLMAQPMASGSACRRITAVRLAPRPQRILRPRRANRLLPRSSRRAVDRPPVARQLEAEPVPRRRPVRLR